MATKQTFTPTTPLLSTTMASNTTSASSKSWKPPAVWKAAFTSVKIGSSTEAVLILSSNLLLLLVIVTSPSLRRQLRYHLVLSLVVANLVVGLFSSPFLVDLVVRGNWVHGCYFNVIRTLLTVFVQNFVSMWGVVLLSLHYLARLVRYEGPAWLVRLPSWLMRSVPALIVASPWILGTVLQVPLVFIGLHPHAWVIWSETRCPIILQNWASILLTCNSYIIPAIILVVLSVLILVRYRDSGTSRGGDAHRRAELGASLVLAEKEELESGSVHVVTGLLSVVLMGPENVLYGFRLYLYVSGRITLISSVFALLLSELLPFVLAVQWLLMYADLRERMRDVVTSRLPLCATWCHCCKSPPRASGATSVAPVSFRDLRDE